MAAKAKNKHPDVKNGGAGRALLERNTGSWHPKRQRAILWHGGSGTGDWEDSYLQNRCLANFWFPHWSLIVIAISLLTHCHRHTTLRKSEKAIRFFYFLICLRSGRKLQRTVLLTAESAESTLSLLMQNGRIGGVTLWEHLANPSAVHSLVAGGGWQSGGQPRSVGRCSSRKVPKNNLHRQCHHGRAKHILTDGHRMLSPPVVGYGQRSKVTSWLKFDWTIKPKSGCHAEEYSTVCGLWRKADPVGQPAHYRTAKISFQGCKKQNVSV